MTNKAALIFILIFGLTFDAKAQATKKESQQAAQTIGRWLSRSAGHYDFQSATTVNPKRAGTKFFGIPDMQMASDYGFSYMQAPRTSEVTDAYQKMGANTSSMASALKLPRFHLNLGFANKHDFTFSYLLPNDDKIQGWGLGYKRVLAQVGYIFFSYRFGYARSSKNNYYSANSYVNDLSASVYLRLIDLYVGVRHWSGKVRFNADIPELQLPTMDYFSDVSELEPYVGVILATTTRTRFTMEASSAEKNYNLAAKFSFHFDSLLPSFDNWFRDPRYIKQ